jgi:hypothetical protein
MAQIPGAPQDDGKIRLPRVEPGMNKVAPKLTRDDAKAPRAKPEKKRNKKDDAKLLARGIKRMERAIAAESENRKAGLEDLKFLAGDQWPADIAAQRAIDRRPCQTINRIPTFVNQVVNDLRQNRPAINIMPVGDRGDKEVAKMQRGLIRAIERDCAADIAYDTATASAASIGWGWVRVLTEFDGPKSFDQVIVVKRVRNSFTVYADPDAQEPEFADGKWLFISEMIPREEFQAQWPDADPMAWTASGTGDKYKNWADQKAVRIAEYFEIEITKRSLVALDNGHTGWEDELNDDANAQIDAGTLKILRQRFAECRKVKWYKLTAKDVLEEKDWAGQWIPMVRFLGNEIDLEGKVKYSGIIRDAKDAQRNYNYWVTTETELIALAPKAPYIGAEGQFEGHEAQWQVANVTSFPYLQYKPVSLEGHPLPAPARQPFAGPPAGVIQAKQAAAQDMMATTGIRFDATSAERVADESGKAMRELRRSGDLTSFHYADNVARSLRQLGRIYVDLIPKIYDQKRMLTILREDDTEEQVQIDPAAAKPFEDGKHPVTGKRLKIFNPTFGRYGVTVAIGPSFATKRIEASESMLAFAKVFPQSAAVIIDLIAKNQDWPGAEEMATRLAKLVAMQHPGIMSPDMKDVPPQVQAMLTAMDAQIKQLTQERMALMKQLTDETADRAIATDKINKDFEAKLLAIVHKADSAHNKDVGAETAKLRESMESLLQFLHPSRGADPQVTELSGKIDKMVDQMSRPKRLKMKRADGSTVEITAESDEKAISTEKEMRK